jgi:hypothetical protein
LLRDGHRAEICRIEPAAQSLGLRVGQEVEMGRRSNNEQVWHLIVDGREMQLQHYQADAIIVRRM